MKLTFAVDAAAAAIAAILIAAPALAGNPVPAAEAGIGLVSMALLGTGYVYLRRRLGRR